jgi:hypothetical protein
VCEEGVGDGGSRRKIECTGELLSGGADERDIDGAHVKPLCMVDHRLEVDEMQ